MDRQREIEKIENIFVETLKLMSLYKKNNLSIPFTLKGNLGEFLISMELLGRFPDHKIDYRGGAFPRIDVSIDNVKIQVKTQIFPPPRPFKNGEYSFEGCPTIKKITIDKGKCDIIALNILYLDTDYSTVEKRNTYIFDRNDFKYFNPCGCWSGKSKGDYTIYNILNIKGNPPPELKKLIDFYNTPEYKEVFRSAKDNWAKIEALL
jgi:hypothetical protein